MGDFEFCLKPTRWIGKIVRVDYWVVHRVGGVDVYAAMAEWVLQRCGDPHIAICIAVHEQKLNLANGAGEDCGGCCVADGLVAGDDAVVVSCVRRVLVDLIEELLFVLIDLATVQRSGVHIGDSIVDVCEIFGVSLQ